MAAGEVLNALPAILHNTSADRHETDACIAANTTSPHCRRLVEPGWIDPDVLDTTFSRSVSHCVLALVRRLVLELVLVPRLVLVLVLVRRLVLVLVRRQLVVLELVAGRLRLGRRRYWNRRRRPGWQL